MRSQSIGHSSQREVLNIQSEPLGAVVVGLENTKLTLERVRGILRMIPDHGESLPPLDLELKAISDQISLLAQKCLSNAETDYLATGVEKPNLQEPIWLAEVTLMKNLGRIPDYRGCKKDGDAYEFYLRHYGPWAEVMNQKALKLLGGESFIWGIKYSAKKLGRRLEDLIPKTVSSSY